MDDRHGREFMWQEGSRHAHDGWWDGPLHAVGFLLLVALLVVGVVWLVRRLAPGAAAQPVPAAMPATAIAADPAVAALRMRYARGEVSREDFQLALQDLTGASAPWPGNNPAEDTTPTELDQP